MGAFNLITPGMPAAAAAFILLLFFLQYQMLPSGEKERSGTSLLLQNASRLDSGTYICAASNGVDSTVDAKIKLRVICK